MTTKSPNMSSKRHKMTAKSLKMTTKTLEITTKRHKTTTKHFKRYCSLKVDVLALLNCILMAEYTLERNINLLKVNEIKNLTSDHMIPQRVKGMLNWEGSVCTLWLRLRFTHVVWIIVLVLELVMMPSNVSFRLKHYLRQSNNVKLLTVWYSPHKLNIIII